MKFGILLGSKIDDIDYIVRADQLGYDSAWVGDSQMIWSDCYATLALAAVRTSRIRLGTGVAVAGTRIAPVTAHSIATINVLAPGRTFLGLGTGDTSMRTMGQLPMRLGEFQRYARTVRHLLDGRSTPYTYGGQTRDVRFLHQSQGYIELAHRVPIYLAAQGPATQRFAGRFADGVDVGRAIVPAACRAAMTNVLEGAHSAGRELPIDFQVSTGAPVLVLAEGEDLDTDRAVRETGTFVMARLHGAWERAPEPKRDLMKAPEHFRDVWEDYCNYIEAMDIRPERRYQRLHVGHDSFLVEEEARFVTPNSIRALTLAGTPLQIAGRLRECQQAGLTLLRVHAPTELGPKIMTDFAEKIFPLLT
jgi:alkanesulfonate monooxygenase SsuD/methylene tetrahydromethanopterin reductase-like flavin-dependent oxidoreductase (luciferase family)